MQMERGLDTGPMLLTAETPVDSKTAGALTAELAEMGAKLIVEALARDTLVPTPQPAEGVTYAHKIDKAEAALDFTKPAFEVERAVRAFNPAPGAFTLLGQERLRILACDVVDGSGEPGVTLDDRLTIACGAGAIRPTLVQRPGKRAMDVAEVLRGFPIPAETRLG
jgi:methionyl-tRNA formyltransferase